MASAIFLSIPASVSFRTNFSVSILNVADIPEAPERNIGDPGFHCERIDISLTQAEGRSRFLPPKQICTTGG